MFDANIHAAVINSIYPEAEEPALGKIEKAAAAMGGCLMPWLQPSAKRFEKIVGYCNTHGRAFTDMGDTKMLETSRSLRLRLRKEGFTAKLVGLTFALVREAADRALGMRHFDVQLIGGWVLLNGMVAEMETGEGKTLTATLAACTAALAGIPVHVVTVNDYLARRDALWMQPVYQALGLKVGHIVHGMEPQDRRNAYRCDITYCTNKEVAFDYLRDRIVLWDRPTPLRMQLERLFGQKSRLNHLLMRGLHFAIVDEADSILIDEARTPLIISAEGEGNYQMEVYRHAMVIARQLKPKRDFNLSAVERKVAFSAHGKNRIDAVDWSATGLHAGEEQRHELVRQALTALYLFDRDRHYLIKDDKVQIIDEYTGRLMADRSWERGLHQLIEIKEDCPVSPHKETRARISYQHFFRRYLRLAGMTGTAREVAGELRSIYRLRVMTIPPNRRVLRKTLADRILPTAEKKWKTVIEVVAGMHKTGRPVLIGTRSVEASEKIGGLLAENRLPYCMLNARQDEKEAEIVAQAGEPGRITVATNMAGRGTDIRLGKGVAAMGGLHVIATERHEARRIDRQLFGRCGRQGDPGTAEAILSLEDELITVYTGGMVCFIAGMLLRGRQGMLTKRFGRMIFGRAQRSAEKMHARMRRDLLKMDDRMSEHLAFTGRPE